jgi:hypothetical protein
MNTKQRSFLVNLNRTLIFVLTLTGLLLDGIQFADLPVSIALLVWLWLPLCTRLEASLMHWIGHKGGHAGPMQRSPFV